MLKKIWQWLVSNSEIWVEGNADDPDLKFLDAESSNNVTIDDSTDIAANEVHGGGDDRPRSRGHEAAGDQLSPIDEHDEQVAAKPTGRLDEIRIHTSQERVWLALTGHGVDWSKCPRKEFELLAVIVRYREKGITQPELVRLTGQDKRSVPKRTTALAKNGYIFKETLAAYKTRTSLLTHKRFKPDSVESSSNAVFVNGNMMLGNLYDFIFGMFEQQKVISLKDVRRMLVSSIR